MYKYINILFCFIHFLLLIVYVLCICVYIATLICIQQFKHQTAVAAPSLSPITKGLIHLQVGNAENWFIQIVSIARILESIYLCLTVLYLLLFLFNKNIYTSKSS